MQSPSFELSWILDDLHHSLLKLVTNDIVILQQLNWILSEPLKQSTEALTTKVIVVREVGVSLFPGEVYFVSSLLECDLLYELVVH